MFLRKNFRKKIRKKLNDCLCSPPGPWKPWIRRSPQSDLCRDRALRNRKERTCWSSWEHFGRAKQRSETVIVPEVFPKVVAPNIGQTFAFTRHGLTARYSSTGCPLCSSRIPAYDLAPVLRRQRATGQRSANPLCSRLCVVHSELCPDLCRARASQAAPRDEVVHLRVENARTPFAVASCLLKRIRELQHAPLVSMPADDLQADWEPTRGKAGGN